MSIIGNLKKVVLGLCAVALLCTIKPINVYAAYSKGVVTADTLNVRDEAGKNGNAIGKVSGGDSVDIIGEENGWYKIDLDGQVGYVYSDYIEVTTGSDDESKEAEGSSEDESVDDEVSPVPVDMTMYYVIGGAVVVIVLLIIVTIKSINKSERDDDEYDDDEYDDDEYDDDEYDDDEYDDDEYDEYDDEYYEKKENTRRVSRKVEPVRDSRTDIRRQEQPSARKPVYIDNAEDFRVEIDTSVFDDDDAPTPMAKSSAKEADLEAAMKKMEELQREIERIKQQ